MRAASDVSQIRDRAQEPRAPSRPPLLSHHTFLEYLRAVDLDQAQVGVLVLLAVAHLGDCVGGGLVVGLSGCPATALDITTLALESVREGGQAVT